MKKGPVSQRIKRGNTGPIQGGGSRFAEEPFTTASRSVRLRLPPPASGPNAVEAARAGINNPGIWAPET
jgi:hypothetical protein